MINCIDRQELWNGGFVELWNFDSANKNQKAREEAIALVGGACRNVTIKNPEKFYKMLKTEHNGTPSEIFQFIPFERHLCVTDYPIDIQKINDYYRFGYINESGHFYSNLRNAINYKDNGDNYNGYPAKSFVVFRIKIPQMIVMHLSRHKKLSSYMSENWQSNRSKHKIEYFESKEVKMTECLCGECNNPTLYNSKRSELINKGEFGLRYTTGWISGWINDPSAWDNFFGVRLEKPTQFETMELANTMYAMMQKYYGYNLSGVIK